MSVVLDNERKVTGAVYSLIRLLFSHALCSLAWHEGVTTKLSWRLLDERTACEWEDESLSPFECGVHVALEPKNLVSCCLQSKRGWRLQKERSLERGDKKTGLTTGIRREEVQIKWGLEGISLCWSREKKRDEKSFLIASFFLLSFVCYFEVLCCVLFILLELPSHPFFFQSTWNWILPVTGERHWIVITLSALAWYEPCVFG